MVTWTPQLTASDPDIIADRVKEAERALRVRFPPAFVEIATRFPMAEPDPAHIVINDFGTSIGHLLHFEEGGFSNIVSRIFPLSDVLDKGVIPFAEDIGGDLYCFNYRGTGAVPSVDFWSADTGLIPLAGSFEEFLGMLMDSEAASAILLGQGAPPASVAGPGENSGDHPAIRP